MKRVLHPSRVNSTARHGYSFVHGMAFGLICFGFVYVAKCGVTWLRTALCLNYHVPLFLQADDVLACCGRNLLCVYVKFITKSAPPVSHIP